MKIDIEQLKIDVVGKWRGILSSLGIDVPDSPKQHGPCPACGGVDRFRFDDKGGKGTYICNQCGAGGGWTLIQIALGINYPEALDRVADIVGSVKYEPVKTNDGPDPAIRLKELSRASAKLTGNDLASKYLRSRGLVLETQNLRYCATCYEPETKTKIPAMIGVIQGSGGEYIGLHRTYLDQNGGRAKIKSQKKLMPPKKPLAGSAIRLFAAKDFVGVAEGIETAIAASQLFSIPVWACISSTLLESFEPPDGIRNITVFGDADANYAGQKSAYRLANRLYLNDYIVNVEVPDTVGCDWADVLEINNKRKSV